MWFVIWCVVALAGVVLSLVSGGSKQLKNALGAGGAGWLVGLFLFHAGESWGGGSTDYHWPMFFAAIAMLVAGLWEVEVPVRRD